jgi:hypothetical protein
MELKTIGFPGEYRLKNFNPTMGLFIGTFTILICISWYYFVTVIDQYAVKAMIYTAFFVRWGPSSSSNLCQKHVLSSSVSHGTTL